MNQKNDSIQQACLLIGQRTANLFQTRQLRCSGAALVVLNQAFGGDKLVLKATRQLHAQFKSSFGAVSCRVLIKNAGQSSRSRSQACARAIKVATDRLAK